MRFAPPTPPVARIALRVPIRSSPPAPPRSRSPRRRPPGLAALVVCALAASPAALAAAAGETPARRSWPSVGTAAAVTPGAATASIAAAVDEAVVRLYLAYFLRDPDAAGFAFWTELAAAGMPLAVISHAFAQAPEFTALYGSLDAEAFVRLLYRNVLGREPDAAGVAYWVGRLAAGVSRGAVMLGFSESPEFRQGSAERVERYLEGGTGDGGGATDPPGDGLVARLRPTGGPGHEVRTRTGGAEWLMSGYTVAETAELLGGGRHAVAFKSASDDFGLRWDTRTHERADETYRWFGRRAGVAWSWPETIDDELAAAEKAGWLAVLCQPVPRRFVTSPRRGEGYGWQTDTYYASMAQYILGRADADYRQRVAALPTLDSNDRRVGGFNWANLRAARGRVAPYPLFGFCVGTEPYWVEDLSAAEYLKRYRSRAAAIRARVPNAPLGLFMMNVGDHVWEGQIVGPDKITSDLVDFLILRDNYHGFGNPRSRNLSWFLGAYNARYADTSERQFNPDGTMHLWSNYRLPPTSLHHPAHAKQFVDRRFPDKPELKDRLIWTEWGYDLQIPPGEMDDLGMAILRAGQFARAIEEDVLATATWTVNNEPPFNFGLVSRRPDSGEMEASPSLDVARMAGSLIGARFVPAEVTGPTYEVDPPHGFPLMRIAYLDAWLFARGDERVIFVINRHRTRPVRLDLEGLAGYRPVGWTQLGGQGFDDRSDNHTTPGKVVARERAVGPLLIEPLSVNLIRLRR